LGVLLWARTALPQTVTASVAVGNSPVAIAVNPVTSTIYVVNTASDTVSVINGTTNSVVATVNTGSNPIAVAVNPLSNMIYVANNGSSNITVINGATNTASTVTDPNAISPIAIALNPITNMVYVANSESNNLTVINGASNTLVGSVGVGNIPAAVVVNPATNMVYVANRASNNVTVVNGANNRVAATVGTGTSPASLALDTATNVVYAANNGSNNLSVISGASNTVTATVPAGTSPTAVTVNPVTGTVYVANNGSSSVTVVNGANNTVTATVTVGNSPVAVAADATTNQIYVVDNTSNNVTVIDGVSNTTATVADPNAIAPAAVAVDPVTNTVYTANNGSSNVTVIDADRNLVTATVSTSMTPVAVALNTVTNKIYVVESASSTVTVIDGNSNTVAGTVNTGTNPVAIAVNPSTNVVYVANKGNNTITVINGTNNSVAATIPTGTNPVAIAVNPVTNTVYVANRGSGNVTVIDGANNTVATTVGVGTTPVAIAVNSATGLVYVANNGSDNVTVFDPIVSSNVTITDLAASRPVALVVDSVTNKIYVANSLSDNVSVIDGATALVVATINAGGTPSALDLNPTTNRIYVINTGSSTVAVIDGNALAVIATVTTGTAPSAVSVNSTLNRIYVANNGNNSTDFGSVTIIDGVSNASTTVTDANANEPYAVAANPVTNEVYVANNLSSNTSVLTAESIQPNPIAAVIVPLTNNQTSSETPTFKFTASNGLNTAPVDELLFQLDSWLGSWTPATPTSPGNFKGTTATLLPGFHTIYAYATEGEEATSAVTGVQSSPLIGTIAAYGFLVATPLADVAPPTLNFGNQQVGTRSSTQTVTLGNPGSAPLTFTYAISPSDFHEGSGDTCGSAGGQLAPDSSCTIFILFSPTQTGVENATLTVTDNSNNISGSMQTVALTGTGTTTSFTLNVAEAGTGGGTVMSSPAGINCPTTTCSANFSAGTSVTLTASPNAGSVFVGWGGACSGSGTCTVTMNSNRAVTATFKLIAVTSCTGNTTNWIGGASGNWSSASNWSTDEVPNGSSVNVCINDGNSSPSQVTLDITASVGALYIDSGSSLTISNNNALFTYGNISNAGQIFVSAAANNTFLVSAATISLAGGGTVTLSTTGAGTPALSTANGAQTLTNVDNTVQGPGVIGWNGLILVNQAGGVINANSTAGALLINSSGITNQGLLEATGGGTLNLENTYSNAGGRILANGSGSSVELINATVRGGTLTGSGGGIVGTSANVTATLDGSSQGTLTIVGNYVGTNNTVTYLQGTINNTGTIQVNATGNNTFLTAAAGATLTGGGVVTLTESGAGGNAAISDANGQQTLTNANNTLQGVGVIGWNGMLVVNQAGGTINANAPSSAGALLVNTASLTNQGLVEATGGGTLQLENTYFNSGGNILSTGSGSSVQTINATIHGGTLTSANGGVLGVAANVVTTLDGSSNQGPVTLAGTYVGANNSVTYLQGTIENTGNIQLNAAASNTFLTMATAVSLTGAGVVTLTETGAGGNAAVSTANGAQTLTNVNNAIQGAGFVGWNGLNVVNQGTIDANLPAQGTLVVNPGGLTNEGLIEATAGATVQLNGSTFNNTGGTILASGTGSNVQFANDATIQSGTLSASGGGGLGVATNNGLFLDGNVHGPLTIVGTYTGANNSSTYLIGTINNTGNIQLNAGANNTFLAMAAGVSLVGNGTVTLSSTPSGGTAALSDINGNQLLTNVDNTLQGTGIIGYNGLEVTNQGTINANVAAGTLTLNPSVFINQGLLEATLAGTLSLNASIINNQKGTIQVSGASSTVQFVNSVHIEGGTLAGLNNGALTNPAGNSVTLDGSALGPLTLSGTFVTANSSVTYLLGTINNTGNFQVNAGANNTFMAMEGPVSLTGNGSVTLSSTPGAGNAALSSVNGNQVLTNVNNLLQGTGLIGYGVLELVNQAGGVINANVPGATNSLTVDPVAVFTNQGLLEATGGGTLSVNSATVNNQTGTIQVNGASSTVEIDNNSHIEGGTLSAINGGVLTNPANNNITLDGSTQGQLTLVGTFVDANNSEIFLQGTINNTGNFQVNAGANSSFLTMTAGVTLTGGGMVTLSSTAGQGTAALATANGAQVLTNVNNTLQGTGVIGYNGLQLANQGTVNANVLGGTLTMNPGAFTNQGLIEATAGGILALSGSTISNSAGTIKVSGATSTVQFVNNARIEGGTVATANNGVLTIPSGNSISLDGSTLGPLTLVGTYVGANNTDTYLYGSIVNNGNIQLNAAANNTFLIMATAVSLTGSGTVTLSSTAGGGTAALATANGQQTLTNVNNIVQGAGIIGWNGLVVINQGTINANAALPLTVNPPSLTNQGLVEAAAGGTLVLSNGTIANSAGTIQVNGNTSSIQFVNNATIQGGTLTTSNGGVLTNPSGNTITLDGSHGTLNIGGSFVGANNTATYLLGTINNAGAIQINAAANNTFMIMGGPVSLTGGGSISLSSTPGQGTAALATANGSQTLTNVSNTLQGSGIIGWNGLMVVNQGTIGAGNANSLTLNPPSLTNAGLLAATAGGTLVVSNGTINNHAGTIQVNGSNSSVQFVNSATIQGGTLATANGGILTIPSGNAIIFDGSSQGLLNLAGTYVGANNTSTFLLGQINNTGLIQLNAAANNTLLIAEGPVSLTGTGTVSLSSTPGQGTAALATANGAQTLTNVGNILQGSGVIGWNGLGVVNQGSINATGSVTLNPSSLTNQGLLEATGAGFLQVSTSVVNAGGSIVANGASAAVQFANGITIQGGILNGVSGGFVGSSSGNVLNVDGTANAVSIPAGATYTVGNNSTTNIFGTINNNGTVLLDATESNTVLNAASGGASLTGPGSVMMTNGPNMFLGTSLLNAGNIILDSATFNVSAYMQNAGLFQVTATGSASSVSFGLNGGTAQVDGTLATSQGVSVSGTGTLSGNGTIISNVSMAGITQAGDIPNPGILTVGINGVGNYTQGSAGSYDVVIGGLIAGRQYSQLNTAGPVSLSGTLNVSLINDFVPSAGNQFAIMNAASLSGQFGTTNLPSLPPNLSWNVSYSSTQVVLSVMSSQSNFTLTVTTLGTGNGTVTDNLEQINCADTAGVQSGICSASYQPGTTVMLTATPQEPTTFGGWGGACSGTAGCSVLMNANQSVTASFVPPAVTMSAPFTCPNNVFPCFNVTAPPAVFNCPSGQNPCPDPNAHSLALTAAQVNTAFTMTVAATEVPMTQADGDCQSGQTPATDFDCRFTSFFSFETLNNGDVIVPACDAYSNGNCVFYSVFFGTRGTEPPLADYEGPISWAIAWNNTSFLPNPNFPYLTKSPQLYDDPDQENSPNTPYGTNCNTPMLLDGIPTKPPIFCQFVFDITSYFDPNQPPDAGIGGRTKHFNDVVVAFPLTIPVSNLSVHKTADQSQVNAGSPIGYTIEMNNSGAPGTGSALNATLYDPLPAGTNVNWTISPPYSGPGTCVIANVRPALNSPATQALTCDLGNFSPSITTSVHVLSANSSAGTYVNTATLAADNNPPQTSSATIQVVNGSGPIATLSPTSVNFGTLYLDIPAARVVTLSNTGSAPLDINSIQIAPPGNDLHDFQASSACPASLGPGQSCKITVTCFPAAGNLHPTATLAVTDNAPGSPQTVPLSATVINPLAKLDPALIRFGSVDVGQTSPPKAVTLTNVGTTQLVLSKVAISGDFAFVQGTTCSKGTTLAPQANCVMNITFTPKAKGKRAGDVIILDNAASRKQEVQLFGDGR
jgi:YVTN family beta-propeller protein/adhesin HecA-like repeat protein